MRHCVRIKSRFYGILSSLRASKTSVAIQNLVYLDFLDSSLRMTTK
ncbi:hypothetical protein [Helicobacter fennelliae]